MDFGPTNPFYAPSTLPFQAPPFDKIKDSDYQPAIEAGMAEQRQRSPGHRRQPGPADIREHICRHGKERPAVQPRDVCIQRRHRREPESGTAERSRTSRRQSWPHTSDAIYLDSKLFERVTAIYKQRDSLKLDAESLRLVEYYYKKFVHSGANLSDSDKDELKKLNEEESTLTNAFITKLLAATKDAGLRHHGQRQRWRA